MFTEQSADTYDDYRDGHRGLKDNILFIPGRSSADVVFELQLDPYVRSV